METGLSLLAHASMPVHYWDEAFLTACFLINRMPSKVIDNLSPVQCLFGDLPDYSILRDFGCACWPNLRPYNARKLEFRSTQCVFLGYSGQHKGYKCLHRATGRVYISREVDFDESVFPFASAKSYEQVLPSSQTPYVTILPSLVDRVKPTSHSPSVLESSEPVIHDDQLRDLELGVTNSSIGVAGFEIVNEISGETSGMSGSRSEE